jgi:hypothetical protein
MKWTLKCVGLGLVVGMTLGLPAAGLAQGRAALVRELTEQALRRAGKEAGQETAEVLARRLESIAARHGDDAARAVAKLGPRGVLLVEQAGEHAPQAVRLMMRHGDSAVWIIANKDRLALFAKLGDDAAESMLRHGQIAEPLLAAYGQPAAAALKTVSSQNARRLAMMADDQTLARIGRTDELWEVIARYGDRAADFVWRNKGALAVGTTLAAFLADPEAFLSGAADLSKVVADSAVQPLASASGQVAAEAARQLPWTLITLVVAGGLAVLVGGWRWVPWAGRKLGRTFVLWASRLVRRRSTS